MLGRARKWSTPIRPQIATRTALLATILAAGPSLGAVLNVPEDTDLDGRPDYVLCGDFDGDGFHRPRDIQACNDALTDTGARHVEVVAQVFDIPDTGFVAPPDGLIRPSANTRISCQPGAHIVGVDERYPSGVNVSIFFVDQPAVTIGPDCEIDGGFPEPVDCSVVTCPSGETRMGVFASTGSAGLVVERNTIHHTSHACIYVRNASDRTIQGNTLNRCGSAWDSSGAAATYPGVYVYANDSASPTLDTKILDNFISGTQGLSLRIRGDTSNQINQGLTVIGNTIVDTQKRDGTWGPCIGIGGVRELFIGENLCQNSSGVVFGNSAPDFYDSNKCNRPVPWLGCFDAVHDVVIDGLSLQTIHTDYTGAAISIGSYADQVVLRNVEIRDVDNGCLHFAGRLRDFQATDLTCERAAFALRATEPDWWPGKQGPSESIHLDGFTFTSIHSSFESVFDFPHGLEHATIANGSVTGYTRHVLRVGDEANLSHNSIQNIDVDQLGPGHVGNALVSDLGSPGWVCDPAGESASLTVLDTNGQDCASPGDAAALCICDGTAWRSAQELPLYGSGPALRLSGGVVDGNVLQGIVASTTRGSDAVLVGGMASGNLVDGVLLEDTAITSAGEVAVAALPALASNSTCYVVTDAADSEDCSSGGGSDRNLCCWHGDGWNGSLGGQGSAIAGSAVRSTDDGANTIANIGCYRTSMISLPCHALLAPPSPVPSLGTWAWSLLVGVVLRLGASRVRRR